MSRLAPIFIVLAVLAAGCGAASGDQGQTAPKPTDIDAAAASAALPDKAGGSGSGSADQVASRAPARTGTLVRTRDSDFGTILVDSRGRTLYLLDSETGGRSECYGECAKAWPPMISKGAPRAGGEAKQSRLGRTTRSNGRRQVTYRGHPLYRYAPEGPREVLCQDVFEFGGTWLVVDPSGNPVR